MREFPVRTFLVVPSARFQPFTSGSACCPLLYLSSAFCYSATPCLRLMFFFLPISPRILVLFCLPPAYPLSSSRLVLYVSTISGSSVFIRLSLVIFILACLPLVVRFSCAYSYSFCSLSSTSCISKFSFVFPWSLSAHLFTLVSIFLLVLCFHLSTSESSIITVCFRILF